MPDDQNEFRLDDSPERSVEEVAPPTDIPWGIILLFVGIVLVVVFAIQNTNPVPLGFLWWEGKFPLAIVILGTAGIAIVLDELAGVAYRRRRRRRLAEKEELERLRTERPSDG